MSKSQMKSYLERTQQTLVDTHHGTRIVEFSAVVGRAEQRHQLPLRKELISVLDDLVRPTDEVHIVLL